MACRRTAADHRCRRKSEENLSRDSNRISTLRAYLPDVSRLPGETTVRSLVDVRSEDEYTGKFLSLPGPARDLPERRTYSRRYNVPWGKNVNEDGTFRAPEELEGTL